MKQLITTSQYSHNMAYKPIRKYQSFKETVSFKIKQSIRDKFKVYCIEKKIDMSELLEKLIEKEIKKND